MPASLNSPAMPDSPALEVMPAEAAPTGCVIAAFDFDGTLTHGDTLLPFLAANLGWPRLAWALLRTGPWLAAYALGVVRNDVAKARLLSACLSGLPTAQADAWAERWVREQLPAQLRSSQDVVMQQLAWHQAAGHTCVMVSASPDIYLVRAAARLGFDALICTEMEVQGAEGSAAKIKATGGPCLTGRMRTPNCHGLQKVSRLQAWLAERYDAKTLAGMTLYAYGDTSGDKPMLRMAQKAWYRGKPFTDAQ
jgi:phosphatidylglycerophosphatase C